MKLGLNTTDWFGVGLTQKQNIRKSFWKGLKTNLLLGPSSIIMVAFQAAKAEKGGFVPAIIGQSLAFGVLTPLSGFASAGLALIPGVGPIIAAYFAGFLLDYPEYSLGTTFARGVRFFTDSNKRIRHLEMGGNYVDTELAARQRFIAIQDMNAAMVPGRRYLGQEALFMHR